MDGVADEHRPLDIQLHVQEGETHALHRGLGQQTFSEGEHQRARGDAALDRRLLFEELNVGEEHLEHAGDRDEVDHVGLGHCTAHGFEAAPDWEVFPVNAKAHGFDLFHLIVP
ncbi:hypothetical protein FQZ97_1068300 [compost metagenome]